MEIEVEFSKAKNWLNIALKLTHGKTGHRNLEMCEDMQHQTTFHDWNTIEAHDDQARYTEKREEE